VDFGGKSDMVDFLGIKMKIHLDSDSWQKNKKQW
jgi:hypothetical protein